MTGTVEARYAHGVLKRNKISSRTFALLAYLTFSWTNIKQKLKGYQ